MPTTLPLPTGQTCANCGKGHVDGQRFISQKGFVNTAKSQLVALADEKSADLHYPACLTELGVKIRKSLKRKQKKVPCGVCRTMTPKNDMRVDLEEKLVCKGCRDKRLLKEG